MITETNFSLQRNNLINKEKTLEFNNNFKAPLAKSWEKLMARIDGFFIWPFLCLFDSSRDCLRHYAADYKINWYGDSGKNELREKKTIIKIVLSKSFYKSKKDFLKSHLKSEGKRCGTYLYNC